MPSAVALLRSALQKSMARLGYANGHAMPQGASNHDSVLHELFIATEGESYFKKRRDAALKAVKAYTVSNGNGTKRDTTNYSLGACIEEVGEGTEEVVFSAKLYGLFIKKATPSKRLDKKKLEAVLIAEGFNQADVLKMIDEASSETKAATTVRATSLA